MVFGGLMAAAILRGNSVSILSTFQNEVSVKLKMNYLVLLLVLVVPAALSLSNALLRIGTRSSKLAQAQAREFQEVIQRADGRVMRTKIKPIDASGDKSKVTTQQTPLAIAGVDFTGTLDEALANGVVDVVVHSLKDIPPAHRWRINAERPPRVIIGAYLGPREDPLDVLVSKQEYNSLQSLPTGVKVGSSSIRRQAQLLACRPDFEVKNIRGNIDARLEALDRGDVDALILASAGLSRLGILKDDSTAYHCKQIPASDVLPAVGQGIIAVTCRADDLETISLLKKVDNLDNRISATAERSFLNAVDGLSPWAGRPPVAALMSKGKAAWIFRALLATPDGSRVLTYNGTIDTSHCNEETALNIGHEAAKYLLEGAGDDFLDSYYKQ